MSSQQTNFAEVPSLLQIVQRFGCFGERKDLVYNGTQLVELNRLVHRLEHLARTHIDSFDPSTLTHKGNQVDLRAHAFQETDKRDYAPQPHGCDGLLQRSHGVHDAIRAVAARQFQNRLGPVRGGLVVDGCGSAKLLCACKLLITKL